MNEFLLLAFITSYTGIVSIAWIMTQVTKGLWDKLKPDNQTRYVVLFWVVILTLLRAVVQVAELEILTFLTLLAIIVEWVVNSAIIWQGIMKVHGKAEQKISSPK
jgi:diacylglycerol kinase